MCTNDFGGMKDLGDAAAAAYRFYYLRFELAIYQRYHILFYMFFIIKLE